MTAVKYSIDTNAILTAWNETYRPANFEGFWKKLEQLISVGRAFVTEEVVRELDKKDDEACAWVKTQGNFSVALDDEQLQTVKELATKFPALAKERLGRMRADAFVIGLAQCKGLTVVTAENRRGPEKMPNLCDACGVQCIPLADLITAEGWKFS
jgi:hypothetical protein